jgi:hypothetical protein
LKFPPLDLFLTRDLLLHTDITHARALALWPIVLMQPTLTWPHCHAYNITNANVSTTFCTGLSITHAHTSIVLHTLRARRGVGQVRAGRTPVIVVACGSYSPITIMHLRLLEDTRDAINTVSTASALALVFGSIVLAHTKSRE